jgi:cyclin-dependent kinase regulatory subunit CKS1
MPHYPHSIEYSDKFEDEVYEYKNVILPESIFKSLPKGKFLNEEEWRAIGIKQSRGWDHYMVYKPEPWILLFRRPIGINSRTGDLSKEVQEKVNERTAFVDKL